MAPLFSFNILTYSVNPYIAYLNQNFTLSPSPGFSASSYSISGVLPAGVSFSTATGALTGPATALTPATTLTVTANLIAGGTSVCTVAMEVTNIPVEAVAANQASATDLVNNKLIGMQNFLADAEQMINNNNQLGIFWLTLNLPDYVDHRWVYFYFSKLNYVVQNLNPTQNDFEFISYFGQPTAIPEPGSCPYGNYYNDLTQPITFVRSKPLRRVKISWSPFQGWYCFPFDPFFGDYPF
jgi:hypothetical protein